jgi:excinuclease ABC subunit B
VPVARVAEDLQEWDDPNALSKKIASLRKKMQEAARKLDFIEAAQLRDEMIRLEEVLKELTEK